MAVGIARKARTQSTCQRHHIATNKHTTLYTRRFARIFRRADMTLDHQLNKVLLTGHRGRHSPRYHEYVLQALEGATEGLTGTVYRDALCRALAILRVELLANPGLVRGVGL